MPVAHYENFPVASWLLPQAYRAPIEAIYHFARSADDIADEGDLSLAERNQALAGHYQALRDIGQGRSPALVFQPLAEAIATWQLPLDLFERLLHAFSQDLTVTRYADYASLLAYCENSANPVGRLLLHLFKVNDPLSLAQSDAVCTGLQLVNMLQDVRSDYAKGRIYMPMDRLAYHGAALSAIESQHWHPDWADLADEIGQFARSRLLLGWPLAAERLPGRIGWEIRLTIKGALRVLTRLAHSQGRVFDRDHRLTMLDWSLLLATLWRTRP